MRRALRKVGRVVREVLLFPFRLIWWILRGVGHALKGIGHVAGEIAEAIVDGIVK